MFETKWVKTELTDKKLFNIPEKSGIYLFVEDHKLFGLILNREILYVGQTNNLKRRIREHIRYETNTILKQMNLAQITCYYAKIKQSNLDFVEGSIFRIIEPPANFIHPPRSNGDNQNTEELEIIDSSTTIH